ncbi:YicC family protein [Bacteroidales bacterium OttesenSCG-928-A17]|nr:YicC family protein [Bacteroidales bacterium OttesenSCG-928-A17]
MIQSMTGFGKSEKEFTNQKVTVEIKSLNSKQLDMSVRIPNIYKEKEMEIRNLISQTVERGKVDFLIYIDHNDKSISTKINADAFRNYYDQIRNVSESLDIPMPEDYFSTILRMPETIKTESNELDENEWIAIKETIEAAINNLIDFRNQEGAALEKIFVSKIENIGNLLKEVEPYEAERVEKIQTRLSDALKKIETGSSIDENRLAQEMIYYIEKLDINEEKVRLKNHLNYFLETMSTEKSQGRKLGFISQEIGREVNTLGSKANHPEIQQIVVRMKDELEQIKEQILNVL